MDIVVLVCVLGLIAPFFSEDGVGYFSRMHQRCHIFMGAIPAQRVWHYGTSLKDSEN